MKFELTGENARKIDAQIRMSKVADLFDDLEGYNTKYDLDEETLDTVNNIRAELKRIMDLLKMMDGCEELTEIVDEALDDALDYMVKHQKYVDGEKSPSSVDRSPYMSLTVLKSHAYMFKKVRDIEVTIEEVK